MTLNFVRVGYSQCLPSLRYLLEKTERHFTSSEHSENQQLTQKDLQGTKDKAASSCIQT